MKKLCLGLSIILMSACSASLNINLKEAIIIEYGDDIKVENLTADEGMTLEEIKDYDAKKVEKQTVTAILKKDNQTTEKKIEIEVKDTKSPEISFKEESISITEGDEFDATSNIESIKDPIDGDINLSEDSTILKDGYLIDSTVNMNTVGEYEVKATAFDINGNKSEKSYTVSVTEKAEEEVASNRYSNSGNTNTSPGGTSNKNNAVSSSENKGSSNPSSSNNSNTGTTNNTQTPPANNLPNSGGNNVLCPTGKYTDKPCDFPLDDTSTTGNFVEWKNTEAEAIAAAQSIYDPSSNKYNVYADSTFVDIRFNDGSIKYLVEYYK